MKHDKIAAEHSIHLYRNLAGLLQHHYGRCQEDTVGWGHYSIYLYSFTVLFFPLTSEWHTFFPNVHLANCYSEHAAVWRQTAGPWTGHCLFNSNYPCRVSVLCGRIRIDKLTSYACRDVEFFIGYCLPDNDEWNLSWLSLFCNPNSGPTWEQYRQDGKDQLK